MHRHVVLLLLSLSTVPLLCRGATWSARSPLSDSAHAVINTNEGGRTKREENSSTSSAYSFLDVDPATSRNCNDPSYCDADGVVDAACGIKYATACTRKIAITTLLQEGGSDSGDGSGNGPSLHTGGDAPPELYPESSSGGGSSGNDDDSAFNYIGSTMSPPTTTISITTLDSVACQFADHALCTDAATGKAFRAACPAFCNACPRTEGDGGESNTKGNDDGDKDDEDDDDDVDSSGGSGGSGLDGSNAFVAPSPSRATMSTTTVTTPTATTTTATTPMVAQTYTPPTTTTTTTTTTTVLTTLPATREPTTSTTTTHTSSTITTSTRTKMLSTLSTTRARSSTSANPASGERDEGEGGGEGGGSNAQDRGKAAAVIGGWIQSHCPAMCGLCTISVDPADSRDPSDASGSGSEDDRGTGTAATSNGDSSGSSGSYGRISSASGSSDNYGSGDDDDDYSDGFELHSDDDDVDIKPTGNRNSSMAPNGDSYSGGMLSLDFFKDADASNDGVLTEEETATRGMYSSYFVLIDSNNDGEVSSSEFAQWIAFMEVVATIVSSGNVPSPSTVAEFSAAANGSTAVEDNGDSDGVEALNSGQDVSSYSSGSGDDDDAAAVNTEATDVGGGHEAGDLDGVGLEDEENTMHSFPSARYFDVCASTIDDKVCSFVEAATCSSRLAGTALQNACPYLCGICFESITTSSPTSIISTPATSISAASSTTTATTIVHAEAGRICAYEHGSGGFIDGEDTVTYGVGDTLADVLNGMHVTLSRSELGDPFACSTFEFGKDPALFVAKRCWCRNVQAEETACTKHTAMKECNNAGLCKWSSNHGKCKVPEASPSPSSSPSSPSPPLSSTAPTPTVTTTSASTSTATTPTKTTTRYTPAPTFAPTAAADTSTAVATTHPKALYSASAGQCIDANGLTPPHAFILAVNMPLSVSFTAEYCENACDTWAAGCTAFSFQTSTPRTTAQHAIYQQCTLFPSTQFSFGSGTAYPDAYEWSWSMGTEGSALPVVGSSGSEMYGNTCYNNQLLSTTRTTLTSTSTRTTTTSMTSTTDSTTTDTTTTSTVTTITRTTTTVRTTMTTGKATMLRINALCDPLNVSMHTDA